MQTLHILYLLYENFSYNIYMEIRKLRTNKGLTQSEAASLVGLSLRTYQNYESGASFRDTFKKNNIIRILKEYEPYSSKKGI